LGAIDNVCATTIMINNPNHTYKSKYKEPNKDDIAIPNQLSQLVIDAHFNKNTPNI